MKTCTDTYKPLFPELRGTLGIHTLPAYVEMKYDGEFCILRFAEDELGTDAFTINKYGKVRWNFKMLNEIKSVLAGRGIAKAEFLGELYYGNGKAGSLYELLSHKIDDDLKLAVHDISRLNDEILGNKPLCERKEVLSYLLPEHSIKSQILNNIYDINNIFAAATHQGYEGVVVKHMYSKLCFGPCDWVKMKFKDQNEYDVVHIDPYKERIEICAYGPPGSNTHVHGTKVGVKAPNRYKKYIKVGDVVTIEHQGRLQSGSLRHPVLIPKPEWK